MNELDTKVRANLAHIVEELLAQPRVSETYNTTELSFDDEVQNLRDYLNVGEYSVAYECIVATLEKHQFSLSGQGAVRLLEVGLIMRYKTDRPSDSLYDSR